MCFFFCFCEISSLHLFYRFVYCKKSNPTFSSGDGEPEKAKQHFRPYFEAMAIRSNTKYIIIVVDIIYFAHLLQCFKSKQSFQNSKKGGPNNNRILFLANYTQVANFCFCRVLFRFCNLYLGTKRLIY